MSDPTDNNNHLIKDTSIQPDSQGLRNDETANKEKTMAEFLAMMDNYAPIVTFV